MKCILSGTESLPEKPTNTDDAGLLVTSGECCICFSFRLDGKLPDVVCPNRSCEVVFHTLCLYQVGNYVRSLMDFFNRIIMMGARVKRHLVFLSMFTLFT